MNPDKTSHDTSAVAQKLYTGLVARVCLHFYWNADLFADDFVPKATGVVIKRTFSQELIAFYNYNIYNGKIQTH